MSAGRIARWSSVAFIAALLALPSIAGASYPGRNGLIAFSACPGGSSGDGCGSELWTMRPDGSGARQVTSTFYGTTGAIWAPDGRRLAFAPYQADVQSASTDLLEREIVGNGPLATTSSGVTTMAVAGRFDLWGPMSWAPDGRSYVIAHAGGFGEKERRGLYIVSPLGHRRLLTDNGFTLTPDGALADTPFTDSDPTWSPDGSLIAFTRCSTVLVGEEQRPRCSLLVIDPQVPNGQPAVVAEGTQGLPMHRPKWSPDGSRLIYSTGDTHALTGSGIWTARRDGTDHRRIYPSGYWPAYSPDGAKIVFSKRDGLYVMPSAGGANEVAKRLYAGFNAMPDWQSLPIEPTPTRKDEPTPTKKTGTPDPPVSPGADPAPGPDPTPNTPSGPKGAGPHPVDLPSRVLRADGRGRVRLALRCSAQAAARCRGTVTVRAARATPGIRRSLLRRTFDVRRGATRSLTFRLGRGDLRALRRRGEVAIRVATVVRHGDAATAAGVRVRLRAG